MTSTPARNGTAAALLTVTVLIASLIAPGMALSNAEQAPFLTNLALRGGMGLGMTLICLLLFGRRIRRHWHQLTATDRRHLTLALALAAIPTLDYTLMANALRYVDTSTAAVMVDVWPLFLVPITLLAYRGTGRYRAPGPAALAATLCCVAGVAALATAEAGSPASLLDADSSIHLLKGLSTAMSASLCIATNPFLTRLCEHLGNALDQRTGPQPKSLLQSGPLLYLTATMAAANLLSAALICAPAALLRHEHLAAPPMALWLLYGTFLQSLAAISWRTAALIASRTEPFAIIYLLPLISLGWLAAIGGIEVQNTAFLAAGAAAVICGNIVIYINNVKADPRWPRNPTRRRTR